MATNDTVKTPALQAYAGLVLRDAAIPELPNHYRGKVRENYDLPDGRRIIIATDRLSAFDRILTAVPLKGQVLTQIARFWFGFMPSGKLWPYISRRPLLYIDRIEVEVVPAR